MWVFTRARARSVSPTPTTPVTACLTSSLLTAARSRTPEKDVSSGDVPDGALYKHVV